MQPFIECILSRPDVFREMAAYIKKIFAGEPTAGSSGVFQGGLATDKKARRGSKGGQLSEGLGEVIGGGMAGSRNFFLKTFEIYGSRFIHRRRSWKRGLSRRAQGDSGH